MKHPYAGAEPKPVRSKWYELSDLEKEVLAALEEEYGPPDYFKDDAVTDWDWPGLTEEQVYAPAFTIVVKATAYDDPKLVSEFIRANPALTDWEAQLIADFIERKAHREHRPIYEAPRAALLLARAKKIIKARLADGTATLEEVIADVAASEGIPETTLKNSWEGRNHAERRARKHLLGDLYPGTPLSADE